MAGTLNFWTPVDKMKFHQKIVGLYNWNREPYGAEDYRNQVVQESDQYVLTCGEELHIADHIAFLAQSEEGARTVSAATLEEHKGGAGLTIRIAGNQTPSQGVLHGLEEIMKIVQAYAAKAKMRDIYFEALFDMVISFSRKRLHERLRSKQSPKPWWNSSPQPSLCTAIRKQLQALRKSRRVSSPGMGLLYSELDDLAKVYENVDTQFGQADEHELLKTAVRKSFSVSTLGNQTSMEGQLRSQGFGEAICQSRTILQIDKIARYLGLCKDLIRFSRQPNHRKLFANINFEYCEAPQALRPVGSVKECHVHGEVQLLLHYEKHHHDPPPRAIGSSKSACFLCDMFIQKHGRYRISHSHKRLYHQWTIPDVHWMTEQQTLKFRGIIRAMILDLIRLRKTCKKQQQGVFNGFESRAHLLFPARLVSTVSTPSQTSQCTEQENGPPSLPKTPPTISRCPSTAETYSVHDPSPAPTNSPRSSPLSLSDTEAPSRCIDSVHSSSLSLATSDIANNRKISLETPTLHLQIEDLTITFDFLAVLAGSLSVQWEPEPGLPGNLHQIVCVSKIPSGQGMELRCVDNSNSLGIVLKMKQNFSVSIVFGWATKTPV
ncbi:MAG: hypothetical protein M1818_008042 [Claussenomyces sp. TS43310]|nr:MAG: hypothetical protein M1818_008042 [Claussenomyces sp. TS43310]